MLIAIFAITLCDVLTSLLRDLFRLSVRQAGHIKKEQLQWHPQGIEPWPASDISDVVWRNKVDNREILGADAGVVKSRLSLWSICVGLWYPFGNVHMSSF